MDRRSAIEMLLALAAIAAYPSNAQADDPIWDFLRRPGALMRHAIAPGTGDPSNFDLGDCSTQRNLDERGRQQARATGEAMRRKGIVFDKVMTSQWCRCQETARLMNVGPVEDLSSLNSFFENRANGPGQTAETLRYLEKSAADARLLLVTHQVNITALTGRGVSSGEIFAVERGFTLPLPVLAEFTMR